VNLSLPAVAPALTLGLLALPVLCGLAGTVFPAFGYLPVLGGTTFTFAHFRSLAAEPGLWHSAVQAYKVGLVSGLISLTIVAGFTAAWFGRPAFTRMQTMVSPLLSVPHAAAALGLAFMIAPSGFLSRLVSSWLTGWERPPDALIINDPAGLTLIAGLVVKEVPFLFLVTLAALPQVPARRAIRLTASMGYGQMAGFVLGTWPGIYRQIRLAVFAVLAFASSTVDVSIILGPTVPATLPVRLVGWMNDPDLSRRFMACAGAVLQIGVSCAVLATWWIGEKIAGTALRFMAQTGWRMRRDAFVRHLARVAMGLSAMIVFGGLASMAVWSFAGLWSFPDTLPDTLTLRTWKRALPSAGEHVITTITIGVAATLLSVILVIGCLLREDETGRSGGQRALAFLYLPLLVPQIGFLFGLQFLLVAVGVDATLPALTLAHMVFVLPYVFLSLSAPWRAFDRRYERVAAGLGASASKILWRVRLPMLLRAMLAAAAVGFAVSVGQYLPTLLIGGGRFATVTTEAVALGSGANQRIAGVYTFLQMMLPFVGFALATAIPALIFRQRRAISTH